MGVRLLVQSCWASGSEGDAVYEFDQTRITIGRGRGADVRLPHRGVSVRHATIEYNGRGYTIVDHETTNGTSVGGSRIVPGRAKPLREGDRIELGGFALVFHANVPIASSTSRERTASLARRLARDSLGGTEERFVASLTVLNGPAEGRSIPLPDPPSRLLIGRGIECDICLDDQDLSREHAEVEVCFDGVFVSDLGSKNGLLYGGRRVQRRLLDDRDEIQLGATVLRFEDPAALTLGALEAGDDEQVAAPRWEPPEPEVPALPPPGEPGPPAPEPKSEPKSEPTATPARSVSPADMVIYVLSSIVFALSVLGLLWLLRSG